MKRTLLLLSIYLLSALTASAQPVRNLIFMIGDGMGVAQLSMFKIESKTSTAFDRAQSVALISTHSANNRVTDSSAAGTALASGHKTNNSMVGCTPDGQPCESMMAKAVARGLTTGIVVTCNLQHATPAAFYAHSTDRDAFAAISGDMLCSGIDVLVGGGRAWLDIPCTEADNYFDAFARRGYHVTENFSSADTLLSGRLLAVLADKHMSTADRRGDILPRATGRTLEILSANAAQCGKGFMLLVEGSLIDYGGHENDAPKTLGEMRDFERAVALAMDFADRTPGTLVVIAADHETGGLSIASNDEEFRHGESGIDYRFSTGGHTATLVPVLLYGAEAGRISGIMDNTDLARRIMELMELQ